MNKYVYKNTLKTPFHIKGKDHSYRIKIGVNILPEEIIDTRLLLVSVKIEDPIIEEIIEEKPKKKKVKKYEDFQYPSTIDWLCTI